MILKCLFWTFYLLLRSGHPDLDHPVNFWISRGTCEQARAAVADVGKTSACEERGFTTEELLDQMKDAMEKGQER
jgi:hypothetical protein